MDTIRRMKLQTLRENIAKDLKVVEVFDYLLSREVLSEDDMQRIQGEKTDKEKARHLLDLLAKKNNEAFEHFVEALRKPYPWLSQQLEAEVPKANRVEERSFLDSMLVGGLPQAPKYHVERKEKLEEVRQHLHSLKRRHYVVLHGMTGCGKSCLAASALDNKELVIAQFKGAVYWVSVGDVNSESSDDLLSHMTDLMGKLSQHTEVGSDRWDQTSISITRATERLRRYFASDTLREGLLILDDVSSAKVIEAFDVGCKILVTTKDSEVMQSVQGRYHIIKISEGFMEHESLRLMAECVGVEMSKLPPQAKKIHQLCKGVPMVIALIGGQLAENKDDVQHNPGRWDYYLNMLVKHEYGNIKRYSFPQGNSMLSAIGFCIANLHDGIKCYYQDFALFVEDVNIKPEVLATLWSRNKYEAEDIMCEFVKKSLAVSKWNEFLNCYVYGIHDLLLHYLRHQLSDEEKKELHKKLLDSYKSVSGGKLSNLPNDNYIYFYIGHHLNEAQMWSEFPELYLDLEFVGAKLKATGPGDLLVDYKKYHRLITRDDKELVAVLQDCEQFVQLRGVDVHKYQDLDVVQCALQEDRNSHVYKKALKIAKERPDTLYMEFLLDQDNLQQPRTLSVKEEVFAACFATEESKILTSDGSGTITLWDTECASILRTFRGHKQRIRHLELSPYGSQFLSCSDDATVKLWNLDDVMCENKDEEVSFEDVLAVRTPSPRTRQVSWNNMFFGDMDGDGSYKTFNGHQTSVLYASFCPKGDEVVSCSSDGFVKVWDYKTENIRLTLQVPSTGSFANSCIFSDDSSVILYGGDNKFVYAYDNDTGCSVSSFKTSGCIIAILSIAESKVVVVTDNSVELWKWEIGVQPCSIVNAHVLSEESSPDLTQNNNKALKTSAVEQSRIMCNITCDIIEHSSYARYTCATVSVDCQYVIVGASDFSITVWDVEKGKVVKKYQNHNGTVTCLDAFEGSSYQLLLSGSDDQTIKLWRIECAESDQAVKLQQMFDVVWDKSVPNPCIPLLAAVDNSNKLQLLRGRTIVTENVPEKEEVTSLMLSSCGQFVVYGCCDGLVKVFEVETKSTSIIIRLGGAVHYLQVCCSNGITVVAASKNNSLKVWRRAQNEQGMVVTCAGQTNVVIQCFLMSLRQKLLSCAQDWSVKVWDTLTGDLVHVLLGRSAGGHAKAADLSSNEDLLVLCGANGSFRLICLTMTVDSPYVNVKREYCYKLDNCISSCKLSYDTHLLALGQDNGNINIWDVRSERSLGTLELHGSTVQNLLFSPPLSSAGPSLKSASPVILVSVADQIGWWNVGYLTTGPCSGLRRRQRSGNAPRSPLTFLGETVYEYVETGNLALEWLEKKGQKGKPELLGCVKLLGREVKKVSASSNFDAFATVDGSGVMYLMKVLQ